MQCTRAGHGARAGLDSGRIPLLTGAERERRGCVERVWNGDVESGECPKMARCAERVRMEMRSPQRMPGASGGRTRAERPDPRRRRVPRCSDLRFD